MLSLSMPRRSFLKLGAAVATVVGLAPSVQTAAGAGSQSESVTRDRERETEERHEESERDRERYRSSIDTKDAERVKRN